MKVVVDTNVLVSAALRDRGPERVVLFVAETPGVEWVVSESIVAEYMAVLSRRKFGLAEAVLHRWERILSSMTIRVDVSLSVDLPRDPADAKFLACAIAAGADFLVTGDRDFEEARRFSTTTIVSVSMFERTVCRNWSTR